MSNVECRVSNRPEAEPRLINPPKIPSETMKPRTLAVTLLVAAPLTAPAATAEPTPDKPGDWQGPMEIPGMRLKMPPEKFTHCVTEEDAKSAITQNQKDKDCKLGEYEVDGQTSRWTVECPKQKTTGKGEITYDGDSMTGKMEMDADGQMMTTKCSGKRLGDCDK